jgi:hypothetical protein
MEEDQKKQIDAMLSAVEQAGQNAESARKDYESFKDQVINFIGVLGVRLDNKVTTTFSSMLDSIFSLGSSAGENSQTAVTLREQVQLMARMEREGTERAKKADERNKAIDERDVEHLELRRKEIAILERLAKATEQMVKLNKVT